VTREEYQRICARVARKAVHYAEKMAGEENPPRPCEHPEHRLGTHGDLRPHQRVCMTCGEVVLARGRHP